MVTSLTWEADPSNEHAKWKLSIIIPALWYKIFCNYKINSNHFFSFENGIAIINLKALE